VSREFLYVQDAAEGIVMAAEHYNSAAPVNLGSGEEIQISELVHLICALTGYSGDVKWDVNNPDGQPRRCLDTRRAEREFGFRAKVRLRDGIQETIRWYQRVLTADMPDLQLQDASEGLPFQAARP
jgi:GDP-L-fucose synthase